MLSGLVFRIGGSSLMKRTNMLLTMLAALSLVALADDDHGKGKVDDHGEKYGNAPEPGTIGLMIMGGAAMIVAAKMRRRK